VPLLVLPVPPPEEPLVEPSLVPDEPPPEAEIESPPPPEFELPSPLLMLPEPPHAERESMAATVAAIKVVRSVPWGIT
jgi:hypothetical protein